ncbi:glycosyltransferase family 2 protein [Thiohalomonas denitrificans]|uniref:glycosyltransferase family 2 protein n=1 Tax=Thiohalomonas denitrificans TaxID=415747 RepID=UPI0026EC98DB|nr:glycosyltransferase family 2 protein [Thiohalomonas denitrificans]
MKCPALSVVLPFYNAESTIAETLDSIGAQTFDDYELVAVDDGSRDASASVVREYARRDSRLRLLPRPHAGVVKAMNAGIAAARAPVIARMDADDRMHPERLRKQKTWLEMNPEIDLVGTQVQLFPREAVQEGLQSYIRWQNACLTPEAIADEVYVELPIANPTVMFRKETIQSLGGYRDGNFPEDYELILRLVHAGRRLAKVPEELLDWRESAGRLTRTDEHYSRDAFDRLRAAYLLCDPRLYSGRPLAFWGAGRKSRRRADRLIREGLGPAAWIDIDSTKIGKRFADAPVVAPQWLECTPRPFVLSFVNNHGAPARIADYLHDLGYRRGRDYLMVG